MIRVLQVIDGLSFGGAQTVVRAIVTLADHDEFEFCVLDVGGHSDEALVAALEENAREVRLLEPLGLWDVRALGSLHRMIRERRIDVVHTHLAGADVVGGAAARLARRPVVTTLHSVAQDRSSYRRRGRRALAALATRRLADRLVAVSDAVKETHVEALGIPPERIDVMRNVSIASAVLPRGFDRDAKRHELGADDRLLVSAVARLDGNRDHETLVRAVAAMPERDRIRVVLAGRGDRREPLEALARELGAGSAIEFLGLRPDGVEILAASDVVCQPTLYEGLPITVLDAMTLGVPVVASAVPGIVGLVHDGESGLLVPPRDSDALASALRTLMAEEERRRLGEGARRQVLAEYDPERWIRRTEAIYRGLAAARKS